MKKLLLAGVVASAVAFGAPGAYASDEDYIGGCGFFAAEDPNAGQGQFTGEADVQMVVYSTSHNPVSATVRCYITVDGAVQPGADFTTSGTVVIAGATTITYTDNNPGVSSVKMCQDVDYNSDGSFEVTADCGDASTFEIPPPIVWDLTDPTTCAAIAAAVGVIGPGPHPGGVEFRQGPNGEWDVYVDGELWFDCPPYEG